LLALIFPEIQASRGELMKRSRAITLTLLASATVLLTSCSSQQTTKRELYQNKEKCVQDWGAEDKCEPASSGHYFYGPHYYWYSGRSYYFPLGGGSPEPVRTGHISTLSQSATSPHSIGAVSSSVTRGGFGHSSSSHGSGS
jgi:uncharacterized protein YgiB involved in biofilm formation